jgi:hypothetical protein
MNPLRNLANRDESHARYVVRAWSIAVVPSLVLFGARVALGDASLRPPPVPNAAALVAYSIVAAPLIETALMVPLALALRALPIGSDWARAGLLAALAALAHGFGGSAWQVVNAFWPSFVYSIAMFAWARRSVFDAFLVATLVHMLYNATIVSVGIAGGYAAGA